MIKDDLASCINYLNDFEDFEDFVNSSKLICLTASVSVFCFGSLMQLLIPKLVE